MAKKRQRTKQVSKGAINQNTSRWSKLARKEWMNGSGRTDAQLQSYLKMKNVVLTIPNPNTNETNKKFIKVNARDVWGSPRR